MSHLRTALASASFALLTTIAVAADPSAAIRRVMESDMIEPIRPEWSSPMVIDARARPKGLFVSAAEYFADYKGRKLEVRELMANYGITDAISIWFSHQDYLIKGHSSTSRFRLQADTYGARWVVKNGILPEDPSLALEFEAVRPDTATARTNNSSATFNATKNNTFAVDYGPWRGLQTQLSYSSVKGAAVGDASIFGLAVGKDFDLRHGIQLRLQGHLVGQTYTDVVEHVSFEAKPILFAAVGYDVAKYVRLEADATFMPSGMPLAGGRFTALSSFQIYRPGGVAEGLRKDAIGFASLRLVVGGKF